MNSGVRAAALALCVMLPAATARASTVFSNDFSSGLTANESVSGAFAVGDGYVGHQGPSYAPAATDIYTLHYNTSGLANPVISFDYNNNIEDGFDFLRVTNFASNPTDASSTIAQQLASYTGPQSGSASFRLDPNTTSVEFKFQSDNIVELSGVKLDNVRITDATEFFNDFSNGLTVYESVTGDFAVGQGYLGHQGQLYAPAADDTYSVNFNTSGLADPLLSFDLNSQIEAGYDHLYVYDFSNGLADPALLAEYTGIQGGPVTLALAAQTTEVKFVFQSDDIVQFPGVKLDNVHIYDGGGAPAAVPEPASWAMMILGFGLVGGLARHRMGVQRRTA